MRRSNWGPEFIRLSLLACLLLPLAHAEPSDAERAGFAITPDMRQAMNAQGAETPKAWLGNAIQYNYQTDPLNLEVGEKYRLPEARTRCAAGEADACATASSIEKWLSWAKSNPLHMAGVCDRSPCAHFPDNLVPAALRGKTWALHAWASWCPYCRLDHLRLMQINAGRQMQLVSLVYQDSEADAAKYLAGRGNPFTGGSVRVSREILEALDLHGIPATFVIGPEGNVLQRFQGTLGDKGQAALEKYFPELHGP